MSFICLFNVCKHHGQTQRFGASVACNACSFTFMQICETLFGNGQSVDYENCRFVCTSMKSGLAMLNVWIMNIFFCCGSSFDTVYHHKTRFGSRQG